MFMRNDHQNSLPEYRLPTEAEWVGQRSIISIRDRKISLVRKLPVLERQNKGDQLANFKQGKITVV
jgi:hypothetical protein